MLADSPFKEATMGKGGKVTTLDANFLKEKDESGEVVGTWAEERKPNTGIVCIKYISASIISSL